MADDQRPLKLPRLSDFAHGARQIAENLRRIEEALPLAPLSSASQEQPAQATSMPTLPAPHRRPAESPEVSGGKSSAQGQASS